MTEGVDTRLRRFELNAKLKFEGSEWSGNLGRDFIAF
jgi:hypothetical protein